MRRWNGWGDSAQTFRLPDPARTYLAGAIGAGDPAPDVSLESVLRAVPPSRLAPDPALSTDSEVRLRHARGQSLPDWIALRSGRIEAFPDGVAFPETDADLRRLLRRAERERLVLIPYGGGTSVVGHINPIPGDRPVLTVDLARLNRLLDFDPASRLATFEAGVRGPDLETQLAARGHTLGHFPQSFEYSTLGGWIAARSTGQQSLGYGRIEDLFAGGHLETPAGPLELAPYPASAAGPDLRQLVLGSEGRLGFITRATVRIRPRPTRERFFARVFRSWDDGVESVRHAAQGGTSATMLRLSDPLETETTFHLAGRPGLTGALRRALRLVGHGPGACLLIGAADERHPGPLSIGGLPLGRPIGELWRRSRFRSPYLRNTLWEAGYALDTLETALPWAGVAACAEAVLGALRSGLEAETERVLAFAHLSHVYTDGASLYVTYLYRRHADPEPTLERWRRLKSAATEAILRHGGTISHQHGVGVDHVDALARQHGETGIAALRAGLQALDPHAIMNPGKLVSAGG